LDQTEANIFSRRVEQVTDELFRSPAAAPDERRDGSVRSTVAEVSATLWRARLLTNAANEVSFSFRCDQQFFANCIPDKFGSRRNVQLAHCRSPVALYRLWTHMQNIRDLPVGQSLRNKLQ
jgi:hypothetical protein